MRLFQMKPDLCALAFFAGRISQVLRCKYNIAEGDEALGSSTRMAEGRACGSVSGQKESLVIQTSLELHQK
jgi:hypothetical protein